MDPTPAALGGLAPAFRDRLAAVVAYCRSVGLPVVVNAGNGRRTMAQHRQNIAAGRSWVPRSKHVDGNAADVDLFGFPPDSVPVAYWQFIGQVGEAYGLRWGGRWTVRDWRHLEL